MRILLLNPRRFKGISYTIIPNLGLGHIAQALRTAGHEVFLHDANRDGATPQAFGEIAGRIAPDMVGITAFSSFLPAVREYAKEAKKSRPKASIALGGPHPTFDHEHTLATIPEADFIIRAEGESALAELCAGLESGRLEREKIPNLAWRENGAVRAHEIRFIEDLDALGLPAWDLIEPHKYPLAPNGIFSRAMSVAPIIATRGCPYACTFCGARRAMGARLRTRSPLIIREEMALLAQRFGIGEIHFMDDNFTQNPDFVRDICELLLEKGPRMPWACPNGIRIDKVDRDLALLMERAGCYSLALGIEFGTEKMLSAIRKSLDVQKIWEQVRMLRETTRMRLTGFFILGHPDETESDVRSTIDFSLRLPLDRANYFNFTPFPGSDLYDKLRAQGAMDGVDLEDLYIHRIAYHPPAIAAKRLARLQTAAHLRFYLRPRILWGLAREIKGWAQLRVVLSRALHLLLGK